MRNRTIRLNRVVRHGRRLSEPQQVNVFRRAVQAAGPYPEEHGAVEVTEDGGEPA